MSHYWLDLINLHDTSSSFESVCFLPCAAESQRQPVLCIVDIVCNDNELVMKYTLTVCNNISMCFFFTCSEKLGVKWFLSLTDV